MTETNRPRGIEGHLDLLRLDAVRAGEGSAEELAHVEACQACRRELEWLMRLCDDVRNLEPGATEIPEAVDAALLAEFRRAAAERRVVRFPSWRWAAPAVGLALAASLAWVLVVPRHPDAPTGKDLGSAERAPSLAVAPPPSPARRLEGAKPPGAVSPPAERAPGDVNGDGGVDILDAYRLAALLREEDPRAAAYDENADGAVDGKDVEELAALAVALR